MMQDRETAQAEFIADVVVSIINQAVAQGVDAMFAAGIVINTGTMALRLMVGSTLAADHLREVASDVEVERVPYDA